MTAPLPRHLAEAALAQIKIQFKGYLELGYEPKLLEQWSDPDSDGDQHWAICWEEGPHEWTYRAREGGRDVELTIEARDFKPDAVIDNPPAPDWPAEVYESPYDGYTLCLYPA